ncbi:Citreoviridin biosynthesis protein [Lachnellula hyalina]|uniref:Citreoviridin biosynthesis protein n=1 Tax=Lachnellula hyalina TaxID=1316788 RepID=A0A8H8U1B1_9HELO|nr:Citreoviridin biosynthesis protein [Lachnellula hyalina]TVY29863.1 Citreoviridin biosynthesis protein [Lachnellula hyalina]
MSQNPGVGVVKKEKKWVRALYALPLLAAVYGAHKTMGVTLDLLLPMLRASIAGGEIQLADGIVVPLYKKYFGIQGLDRFISAFVTFFTPIIGDFDPISRTQGVAFLGDLIPLQTIWLVEGVRRGNYLTAAHLLPTVLGILFQIKGLGFIAPIWFFLHYVQSPLENYHAAENRLTQIGAVKTIIPTIMLSYILPSIAMCYVPGLENRQWINGLLWQAFPLYAAVYQRIFGLFVKDTTEADRVSNPEADIPYLRRAYGFAAVTAAAFNLYARFNPPGPIKDVFFAGISSPSTVPNIMQGAAMFLKYDQIATFSAGAAWIMLSFWDLKSAGKVHLEWQKIFTIFGFLTSIFGPGAAMMIMWAWREEALVAKKKVAKKN